MATWLEAEVCDDAVTGLHIKSTVLSVRRDWVKVSFLKMSDTTAVPSALNVCERTAGSPEASVRGE